MNQFIETLKTRVEEAQRRLQVTTANFQAAQVEHQAAVQAYNSWNTAYQEELRKEQSGQGEGQNTAVIPSPQTTLSVVVRNQTRTDRLEVNKTEIVRDILRGHPGGMSASDLWRSVNTQIAHRPYLYSILKRLNDKGDVFKRRGKYFPRIGTKQDEGKEGHAVIQ
ncbi:MAG: hypothetical protein WBL63_07905 [Candidatus Acidiferrum sp.]